MVYMYKLIRGAEIYAPDKKGVCSILIYGDRIVDLYPSGRSPVLPTADVEVIEAKGLIAIPGLIDQHVHTIGGGGEAGPVSRIKHLSAEECLLDGVTTVVGLLGTDSTTKSVRELVAYTKELNRSGLDAYCLTGAYDYPSPTVMGNVRDDIVFINEIIGVKLAIADHRSSYPTSDEIIKLAVQARNGGLIAGKAGYVHLHVGKGKSGLGHIFEALDASDLPVSIFRPTHAENQLADMVRFGRAGGYVDFTAGGDPEQCAAAVTDMLEQIEPHLITASSDANGSIPVWGTDGGLAGMAKSRVSSMSELLSILVKKHNHALERALPILTANVARALGIDNAVGTLRPGSLANIALISPDLAVRDVISKGNRLIRDGQSTVAPYFLP